MVYKISTCHVCHTYVHSLRVKWWSVCNIKFHPVCDCVFFFFFVKFLEGWKEGKGGSRERGGWNPVRKKPKNRTHMQTPPPLMMMIVSSSSVCDCVFLNVPHIKKKKTLHLKSHGLFLVVSIPFHACMMAIFRCFFVFVVGSQSSSSFPSILFHVHNLYGLGWGRGMGDNRPDLVHRLRQSVSKCNDHCLP